MVSLKKPELDTKPREVFCIGPYQFKQANQDDEIEQIHRLNHQTFVREIPQHRDPGSGLLIDKYHHKNTYFVAIKADQVVGMISVHGDAPYSITDRLSGPEDLHALGDQLLEIRLLAIDPEERHTLVFGGLAWCVYRYARDHKFEHLLISGVEERVPLYKRFGFRALGDAKPCGDAAFVPMALNLSGLPSRMLQDVSRWKKRLNRSFHPSAKPVSLLPGPPEIAPDIQTAFHDSLESHRSVSFVEQFESVRTTLREMTLSDNVAMLFGSGTLANDAVAASIASDPTTRRGLVISNGEFGDRLVDHANRAGLDFEPVRFDWGEPWHIEKITTAMDEIPNLTWIWGVHQESSTGCVNDMTQLIAEASLRDINASIDCISSLGAMPLDLSQVYLATGVSGKALGSYAGLSFVFANQSALARIDSSTIPSYLDIKSAIETNGPRFTTLSSEIMALKAALETYRDPELRARRYLKYADLGRFVRNSLRNMGLPVLVAGDHASPVITTIPLKNRKVAAIIQETCEKHGYPLGGRSGYLQSRAWLQIATMGSIHVGDLTNFFDTLSAALPRDLRNE